MAKVFLLHMHSRTCAALVASAIFKRYSDASQTVYVKEKYRVQSLEFESYAAKSIEICYQYNESLACELLLRQIPLFGNVTCMQVSYSHLAPSKDTSLAFICRLLSRVKVENYLKLPVLIKH